MSAIKSGREWPPSTASRIPCRRGRPASTACATPSTTPHATANIPNFKERRDEEDALSATVYASLPYPENQLVSLAHSLVARGIIDETELKQRLTSIRERLEA